MPQHYPLENLLAVRLFREETAERGLSVSQNALRLARDRCDRAQAELSRFAQWRQTEVDRRYRELLGKNVNIKQLTRFNEDLAALAEIEQSKRRDVDIACDNVRECEDKVKRAAAALRAARRDTAKIETHRELWLKQMKQELERSQEREFEDVASGRVLQSEDPEGSGTEL